MRTVCGSDSLFHAIHLGLVQIMKEPYSTSELREAVAFTASNPRNASGKEARASWERRLKYAIKHKDTHAAKELEFAWPLLSSTKQPDDEIRSLEALAAGMTDPKKYAGDGFAINELQRRLRVRVWTIDPPPHLTQGGVMPPRVMIDGGTLDTISSTLRRVSEAKNTGNAVWRGSAWNIVLVHDARDTWRTLAIKDSATHAYFVAFKTLDLPHLVIRAAIASMIHKPRSVALLTTLFRTVTAIGNHHQAKPEERLRRHRDGDENNRADRESSSNRDVWRRHGSSASSDYVSSFSDEYDNGYGDDNDRYSDNRNYADRSHPNTNKNSGLRGTNRPRIDNPYRDYDDRNPRRDNNNGWQGVTRAKIERFVSTRPLV